MVDIVLSKIHSIAVVGLSAVPVTVEVDIAAQGLPSFTIVGLPDKAVEESKERVRAAIKNSGAEFPAKRITVNLAPADLPKIGPSYDLPIALGILLASGQLPALKEQEVIVAGELSLDGSVCHTNGIIALALYAKEQKISSIFIPLIDSHEAAVIQNIRVYPIPSLLALYRHCMGIETIQPIPYQPFQKKDEMKNFENDMADIMGQEHVKRALEIAAAGGHNIFLTGPPGAGKTLLARTLPSILPSLTEDEALEVTKIYSVTGNLPPSVSLMTFRPFRSPHHTTSRIGLIGGGAHPMPGEISLAHRGILFLDEFPEFPRSVLEALRQPMEDGLVTISRASGTMTYPAKFILIAAANPCPCGNYGSLTKRCMCSTSSVIRYKRRISGPMLDRIDIFVTVPPVETEALSQWKQSGETSESIQNRVQLARDRQENRKKETNCFCNAELSVKKIKTICPLSPDIIAFLQKATTKFGLSARSYYRIIKVSKTIADLAGSDTILLSHVAEALQYRLMKETF